MGLSTRLAAISSIDRFERPDAPLALVAVVSGDQAADSGWDVDSGDSLAGRTYVIAQRAPTRADAPPRATPPTLHANAEHPELWPRAPPSA